MRWLTLRSNDLSGSIPAELGQLTNLEQLYLSGNQFSGCIPVSLQAVPQNDFGQLGLSFCDSSVETLPPDTEDEPSVETPDELDDSDRAILMVFYRATSGGSAWTGNNWSSDEPIGTWEGVATNAQGRVTRLVLNNRDLSGSIPAALGQLTKLEQLNLYENELSGSIPAALGQLTNLTELRLGRNYLSGSIPDELGNLTNLKRLILYINELRGSIPSSLGNLTNLTDLRLSANELRGSIPSSLGNLTNLT